jgi:hypothetical protein
MALSSSKRDWRIIVFLAAAAAPFSGNSQARATHGCRTVSGTYAIYANHDLLRIDGSRHFVEVTSAKLDAELQKRGWEDTVAHGRFAICGSPMITAQRLSIQDRMRVQSWSDLHFRYRKPENR